MIFSKPIEIGQYIRIGQFTVDEVLPYVVDPNILFKSGVKNRSPEYKKLIEKDYEGHRVKMDSQRYLLFASKGVTCVECGLVGSFFGLEKNRGQEGDRYHFNLYGIRDGIEILMTKDHVIPKSKGGLNTLDNYQIMCFDCNIAKGDSLK